MTDVRHAVEFKLPIGNSKKKNMCMTYERAFTFSSNVKVKPRFFEEKKNERERDLVHCSRVRSIH